MASRISEEEKIHRTPSWTLGWWCPPNVLPSSQPLCSVVPLSQRCKDWREARKVRSGQLCRAEGMASMKTGPACTQVCLGWHPFPPRSCPAEPGLRGARLNLRAHSGSGQTPAWALGRNQRPCFSSCVFGYKPHRPDAVSLGTADSERQGRGPRWHEGQVLLLQGMP